ncbi:hypothetical protein [Actinophytocola sp.]|uniref:hypothetical protein n=1 Tax=Actinophytocola sp. TaxID=1872138 RepID=UPI002EDA79B0
MSNRVIALACIAVLGLAGCTTPPSTDRTSPTEPTERPSAPSPKDRDKGAVLAALRRLDLCALLDKAMAATPQFPPDAEPTAHQPFQCRLDGMAHPVTAAAVTMIHDTRLSLPVRAIGGAKAYVDQGTSTCDVFLPVSFELAIQFSQMPQGQPNDETCRVVTTLATASAAALADPTAVQIEPRWDACSVLRDALGSEADEAKLVGNTFDDCTDFSHQPIPASISFADDFISTGQPRTETIGGKQVRIYAQDGSCDIYWRQGPFSSKYATEPDYQVLAITPDCDRSKALAESLMTVLGTAPPADVAPQRPLLYTPDEPDSPYPGACAYVDVSDPKRCKPYAEVPVPADPAKIPAAALADADVLCAVAVDAVATYFGTRLRPVAVSDAGTDCYFVEPERQIHLGFTIDGGPPRRDPGDRQASVAGHPGYVAADASQHEYRLSTSSKLDGHGTVTLAVTTGPVNSRSPLPTGTDKKTKAVLADILRTYFS